MKMMMKTTKTEMNVNRIIVSNENPCPTVSLSCSKISSTSYPTFFFFCKFLNKKINKQVTYKYEFIRSRQISRKEFDLCEVQIIVFLGLEFSYRQQNMIFISIFDWDSSIRSNVDLMYSEVFKKSFIHFNHLTPSIWNEKCVLIWLQ